MKRCLATMVLMCLLSVSAAAGDLPTAGITSTQPGDLPTAGVSSPGPTGTTSPGDLPTGGFADQVSDAAFAALLSVLSLVGA